MLGSFFFSVSAPDIGDVGRLIEGGGAGGVVICATMLSCTVVVDSSVEEIIIVRANTYSFPIIF